MAWRLGSNLSGGWAVAATVATAIDPAWVQALERQMQTVFFETRGSVAPPQNIVILAIDESSLSQGEFFRADPNRYSDLEPIQAWPWQRSAYAIVVDKLMVAGAKAVAIDLIFSTPSSYGEADDRRFAQSLQQHSSRIVLASQYAQLDTPQGFVTQLETPLPEFCETDRCLGFINFLLEPNGRIHQFGDRFLARLMQDSPPEQAEVLEQLPTFAESTLKAAQISYPERSGNSIFFYGPAQTFDQVPFWQVLDSATWRNNLQSGAYFKDKIVIIGSTALAHQDFHAAPFSGSWLHPQQMAGVELHANAIATRLEGKSIAEAIPNAPLRGLIVFVGIAASGWIIQRPKQPFKRLAGGLGLAIVWTGISYALLTQAQLIVPVAIPITAIAFSGVSLLVAGSIHEQLRKQKLRDTLKITLRLRSFRKLSASKTILKI
ncbi:MAG: CHASE2 domain-containing protein [Leptolyngbyaceae cyanobacterium SM1_3_5]|nr:CHASE2 domain-containing protein [Leptolyngbyaceae cyanobacterium SM1_3_5]